MHLLAGLVSWWGEVSIWELLPQAPPFTECLIRTSPLATPADTGTVLVHRELTVTGTIKFGIWEGSLSRGVAGH